MLTEWRPIVSFPGYSVSDTGLVRNDEQDRIMTLMVNQFGIVNVGLTRDRIQYRRAVCRLVAHAFLVPPRHETFDTPVNLDGDRLNNHVENLLWRPRHFATRYFAQFKLPPMKPAFAVEEVNTGEQFHSSWEAAITYGLIELDVRHSTRTDAEVWPTYQRFSRISN
jgi:hypothetical protein